MTNICTYCQRNIEDTDDYVGTMHSACIPAHLHQFRENQRLVEMILPIIEEVNGGRPEDLAKAIIEALMRSHRTLQQAFWSAIKLAIDQYGELPEIGYVDIRNKSAHDWTAEVMSLGSANAHIRFPYI